MSRAAAAELEYAHGMTPDDLAPSSRASNFAEPTVEPTDDEIGALMKEAFAHVAVDAERALASVQAEIAKLRAEALERIHVPSSE